MQILPIRHFSPACATRLVDALEDLDPEHILIEGPSDFRDCAALTAGDLVAPVALFAHVTERIAKTGTHRHVGWYPFTDYSPELVAMRWAARHGVPVQFADIPSHARVRLGVDETGPVASRLADALRKARSRDVDELWDALFETQRDEGWTGFFERVGRYGRWTRDLIPDATLGRWRAREAFMAAVLRRAPERAVLICGAVHVSGVEAARDEKRPAPRFPTLGSSHRGIHLTAFSFAQLADLPGGDVAPAFHQECFEAGSWLVPLYEAARALRAQDVTISTADLIAAAELAERLARFRERPSPTRADIRDAIRSAWTKGSVDEGFDPLALADAVFRGTRIGRIGTTDDPPLFADVRRALRAARFPAAVGESKTVRIRPMRAAGDRRRAELLQRIVFLDVPYAAQRAGPRYLEGKALDRVEQHWTLSWTEETERIFIERASLGPTLRDAAVQHLHERSRASGPRAVEAARRVLEACALGLHDRLGPLLADLRDRIDSDPELASVLAALHELWLLHAFRDALGAVGSSSLAPYLGRCWSRSISLLHGLRATSPAHEEEALAGLRALDLVSGFTDVAPIDRSLLLDEFAGLADELTVVPGIHLASRALLWIHGRATVETMMDAVGVHLREANRFPDAGGRAVCGLLALARRAYLDHPGLLRGMSMHLASLDDERFLCALPELRRAHARLTPWETTTIAAQIERRCCGGAPPRARPAPSRIVLERHSEAIEQDLQRWGIEPASTKGIAVAVRIEEPSDAEPLVWGLPDGGDQETLRRRWRLILGRFAEAALPLAGGGGGGLEGPDAGSRRDSRDDENADDEGDGVDMRAPERDLGPHHESSLADALEACDEGDLEAIDRVLGFLFDREYDEKSRGLRRASDGTSQLTVPRWLRDLHRLFPPAVREQVESLALERYGLMDLVTDPNVLERLEPSVRLLDAILKLKDRMDGDVLRVARGIIRRVADELSRRLQLEAELAFGGRRGPRQFRPRGRHREFAAARTVAANLAHYDLQRRRLVVQQPWFSRPIDRQRWRVIICVDQSGSMLDSVVHATVVASIFHRIERLEARLVAFDTRVVDLSDHLSDPTQALMSVQLGGGTQIARALAYSQTLIADSRRTIVVLISDLFEGGDPIQLETRVAAILEHGAKVLVIAALDDREGTPAFDREMARRLASRGAHVAALSPEQLVRYVAEVLR